MYDYRSYLFHYHIYMGSEISKVSTCTPGHMLKVTLSAEAKYKEIIFILKNMPYALFTGITKALTCP